MRVCDKCEIEITLTNEFNIIVEECTFLKSTKRFKNTTHVSKELCTKCGKELVKLIKEFLR